MRERVVRIRLNPGWRKPVDEITDRAKRYRANHPTVRPVGNKCFLCGAKGKLDVHHQNGDESDGSPDNLALCCRSCNVWLANRFRDLGLGVKTNQYNPRKASRDPMRDYHANIMVMRGIWPGDESAAAAAVHAAPAALRSRYSKQVWEVRKQRYGASGRVGGDVPF